MKLNPADGDRALDLINTLRDYLAEAHQDEIDNHHHGDEEGTCSYCKALHDAAGFLALHSDPDDDGIDPNSCEKDPLPDDPDCVSRDVRDIESSPYADPCESVRVPCHLGGTWHNFPTDGVCTDCGADDPRIVKVETNDGYMFSKQPDGSWGDGDMSWGSLAEMLDSFAVDDIHFSCLTQEDIDNAERGKADQVVLKQAERVAVMRDARCADQDAGEREEPARR